MIDTLENHPSIVVWVPFNEAWGQHRTVEVGNWVGQARSDATGQYRQRRQLLAGGRYRRRSQYPDPGLPVRAGARTTTSSR